jgi:ATP-dependent Clp protease ATP-binding subunit ClpA
LVLNRIDDIIVFHSLSLEHIKVIIRLMVARINKQIVEKGKPRDQARQRTRTE